MADDYRGKTQRRSYENLDISGAMALGFYEKTFQVLNKDAENSLKRPWHKLERGLRIGRLRDYVTRETDRLRLNVEDADSLFKLLLKALDRKLLNSKAAVSYDGDTQQITEVKGLVSHTAANGTTKYQILEKKAASTQKKRTGPKDSAGPKDSTGPKDLVPVNSSELKNETADAK